MKGGGRRDGSAESRPHRCPRGILGANGLEREAPHCLGCEARGEQVSTGRAAPHARRLHTLNPFPPLVFETTPGLASVPVTPEGLRDQPPGLG